MDASTLAPDRHLQEERYREVAARLRLMAVLSLYRACAGICNGSPESTTT